MLVGRGVPAGGETGSDVSRPASVLGLSWALPARGLPPARVPRAEVPFGLLFICLPFTRAEVSAEEPASPVQELGPHSPPLGLPAAQKVNSAQEQCRGRGQREVLSLASLCPRGPPVTATDGGQTPGLGRKLWCQAGRTGPGGCGQGRVYPRDRDGFGGSWGHLLSTMASA